MNNGWKLIDKESEGMKMGRICPNCQNEVESDAHFCTQCGYKFNEENGNAENSQPVHQENVPVTNEKPSGNSNKALIIVVSIVGALILIGVGILVALRLTEGFMTNPETKDEQESETSAVVLQLPTYSLPGGPIPENRQW
ncbi:zinc-ribbon domain-containing protein [Eubacteriaceae bacterium ES3]|nr:zinc-ribbon domain-containing protein [Eubacteriaceae bacterium ES3]